MFKDLFAVNCNEHTEKKVTGKDKNGRDIALTYLSWPFAWAEVKKRHEDAQYEIIKNEHGLPYFYDPNCGIMVYTKVTIDNITHEMWLPVMDGANNAMTFTERQITTKWGTKTIAAATMMDVNKAVMRCLTKNLAMFGLGLYIYAGEDLPVTNEDVPPATVTYPKEKKNVVVSKEKPKTLSEQIGTVMDAEAIEKDRRRKVCDDLCAKLKIDMNVLCTVYKNMVDTGALENKPFKTLTNDEFNRVIDVIEMTLTTPVQ